MAGPRVFEFYGYGNISGSIKSQNILPARLQLSFWGQGAHSQGGLVSSPLMGRMDLALADRKAVVAALGCCMFVSS